MATKFYAFEITRSAAIFSDALESIINVIAAIVAFFVMRAVAEPADDEHPYGHGKLEYFSAAFEGGLITLAGVMIAREAVIGLIEGVTPRNLDMGLLISVGAALANLGLGFYLRTVGRSHQSAALEASGHHVLSDVWSTAGALVGLLLVRMTGLSIFDSLAALGIAAQLSYSGYQIVRSSIGGLIDEAEPAALSELAKVFEKNRREGIVDAHLVKMIRGGKFHHIDAHLVVPGFWTVEQAHEVADGFERAVIRDYSYEAEIAFHLDPCWQDFCSSCNVSSCPQRLVPYEVQPEFSAHNLVRRPKRDK